MNITVDTPFSVPITQFFLEKDNLRDFNKSLIKELLDDLESDKQKSRTGIGVRQTDVNLERRKDSFGELKEALELVALPYLRYIGVRSEVVDSLEVNSIWGNVTSKPAYHINHTHGYGKHIWTGVYFPCELVNLTDKDNIKFLTAEEANIEIGKLVLQDPSFEVKTCLMNGNWGYQENPTHFSKMFYNVIPKEGLVVLFPTWLSHNVEPTFEASLDKSRVSIAFMIGDVF